MGPLMAKEIAKLAAFKRQLEGWFAYRDLYEHPKWGPAKNDTTCIISLDIEGSNFASVLHGGDGDLAGEFEELLIKHGLWYEEDSETTILILDPTHIPF